MVKKFGLLSIKKKSRKNSAKKPLFQQNVIPSTYPFDLKWKLYKFLISEINNFCFKAVGREWQWATLPSQRLHEKV